MLTELQNFLSWPFLILFEYGPLLARQVFQVKACATGRDGSQTDWASMVIEAAGTLRLGGKAHLWSRSELRRAQAAGPRQEIFFLLQGRSREALRHRIRYTPGGDQRQGSWRSASQAGVAVLKSPSALSELRRIIVAGGRRECYRSVHR